MIKCLDCDVEINKNNFWAVKHKNHCYYFVEKVKR